MTAMLELITKPGLYDVDEAVYHQDPVKGGSLSSSGARKLLPPSCPARFDYERRNGRPPNPVFDFGHAAHAQVLGVGAPIVEIDADDWRGKSAREQRDEAYAAGMTPLLVADAMKVYAMADAVRSHPVAGPLFTRSGRAEQTFVAPDPESGVWCRARPDWMPDVDPGARLLVVDLKTGKSAHPQSFARSMADFGYHLQGPFYTDVLTWLGLAEEFEPRFVLVAVEKEPPYLVSVGSPSQRALEWGRVLNRKARDIYRQCVETGTWPGYGDDVALLDIPGWLDHQYGAALDAGAYDTVTDDLRGLHD